MRLKTRIVLMVTFLLIVAVLTTTAVLTWTARSSILAQTELDGLLIAHQLARTAKFVEQTPRDVEKAIGDQMPVNRSHQHGDSGGPQTGGG